MSSARRHLLVVYHSKTGRTARLAQALLAGTIGDDLNVAVRVRTASGAEPADLLWAHGVALGTPENFGYMAGAVKDFFDRTFYEVEGLLAPLPYVLFVSAGNDGTGAVRAIERIVGGYPWARVQAPLIVRGEPTVADLEACRELGMALAYGLDAGIF